MEGHHDRFALVHKMTPKRPRAHVIEDESFTALSSALPKRWILRREERDYGIDGSVELVTEQGEVTGRRFFLQLKGTDAPDLQKALRVRINYEAAQYYAGLPLPTLIVRYHAPTASLYARWFHDFDPYYGRRGKKTVTVRLEPGDRWTASTPPSLEKAIDDLEWLGNPYLALPITLSVITTAPLLHGRTADEWTRVLERVAKRTRHILDIRAIPSSSARGTIRVAADELRVELPRGKRMVLHTKKRNLADVGDEVVAALAFVLVAGALVDSGHVDIASKLTSEYAPDVGSLLPAGLLPRLGRGLNAAGQFAGAVTLATVLVERGLPAEFLDPLVTPSFLFPERVPPQDSESLLSALEKWTALREREDEEAGAIARYNLGRHFGRTPERAKDAVRAYGMAARKRPRYRTHSYFWRELGAILFEARHFRWSARCYERALAISSDAHAQGRYADALSHAGDYAAASHEFRKYLDAPVEDEPVWELHAATLPLVREMAGCDTQRREPEKALAVFSEEAMSNIGPDAQLALCRTALKTDALCGLAWYNLGVTAQAARDHDRAFQYFLVAALHQRWDVEAWANAILEGLQGTSSPLFIATVIVGYRIHGSELRREFARKVRAGSSRAEELIEGFTSLLAAVPELEEDREIRLHGLDGELERIVLSGPRLLSVASSDQRGQPHSDQRAH